MHWFDDLAVVCDGDSSYHTALKPTVNSAYKDANCMCTTSVRQAVRHKGLHIRKGKWGVAINLKTILVLKQITFFIFI